MDCADALPAFLDGVEDALLVFACDLTCIYANPAARDLFGLRPEVSGSPLRELSAALGGEELERVLVRAARHRPPSSFEYCDPASSRWFEVKVSPAAQSHLLVSLREITQDKQRDEQLGRAAALLRLVEKSASLGTFTWDLRTGFIESSPELEQLFGVTSGAREAARWFKCVVPEDRERLRSAVADTLANRRSSIEADFCVRLPDGTTRWIEGRALVEYDSTCQPSRMIGILRDVTRRKQGEIVRAVHTAESSRSEAILAFVQSAARFGIWDWNLETNKSSWSPELYRLYHLDERTDEASYDTWLTTIHPADRDRAAAAVGRAASARQHLDIEYRLVDGRWLAGIGEVFADPRTNTPHMVGINIDITYLKEIEETLRLSNEELRRSNEELQRFAFVASHDLQEPLRMITSFAELLVRRNHDKLDEESLQFAKYVQQGAERMRALIAGLLDYSRVGEERTERKVRTDMSGLLNFARMHLAPLIAATSATLTSDPLPVLYVDDDRMLRVLQNLLSNAIKYRGYDPPEIHVSGRLDKGEYVFSVRDNGIGFDMKYAEQIFGIFQRLHAKSEIEGAGLGLAIVKRIIEAQGGRVWAESEPGQGSTFYFTLPANSCD